MRIQQIKRMAMATGLMVAWACLGTARGDFYCGTPTKVPNVNDGFSSLGGSVSADGLSLYFTSQRAGNYGENFDVCVATRATTQDDWGTPRNLGATINGTFFEHTANISPDGLSLLFSSDRPGGWGGMDMWMATRAGVDSPWSEPVNLGPTVNSAAWDLSPRLSADGLSLYFHSARPGGLGGEDIWVATRTSKTAPWGTPTNLGPTINTGNNDGEAVISPNGLVLFFSSDRIGGAGSYDLWMATRKTVDSPWTTPVNLGPKVNSASIEWCGSISADGSTLYFCSDRPTTWGPCTLYQATLTPMPDFNGDGMVDGAEVRILAENWGTDESMYDIGPMPYGDGVVDAQDLLVLSEYVSKEVLDPAIVSLWKLDEYEGDTAANAAGGPEAKLVGNPLWRPGDGAIGGAIRLDGVDDCLIGGFDRDPSKAPWSVFAWVKGGAPGQVILSQEGGVNWLTTDPTTGAFRTDLRSAGRLSRTLATQTVVTDGQWHHIGLTWDGNTRTLCVDGAIAAQDSQGAFTSVNGPLHIGCGSDMAAGSYWSGLIDDVRIYDRTVKP
jgi:Tol biopolymer transport system component